MAWAVSKPIFRFQGEIEVIAKERLQQVGGFDYGFILSHTHDIILESVEHILTLSYPKAPPLISIQVFFIIIIETRNENTKG